MMPRMTMAGRLLAAGHGMLRGFLRWRHMAVGQRTWLMLVAAAWGVLVLPGTAAAQTLREIGEWVLACDNTDRCSMLNVGTPMHWRALAGSSQGFSRLCIHRDAATQSLPSIHLTLRERPAPNPRMPRLLRITGSNAAPGDIALLRRASTHWEVPATTLTALRDQAEAMILAPDGCLVERLSLAGIDTALALMDAVQNRLGSPTALRPETPPPLADARRAPAPATLVTAPLPLLRPDHPMASSALALRQAACGAAGPDDSTGYRIIGDRVRPDRVLWATRCDTPDGQARSLFVIENADGSSAPVEFPGRAAPDAAPGVIAATLDPERGLLREQWQSPVPPAPGMACTGARLWGWTGRGFELAEERQSLRCAGEPGHWLARSFARSLVTPALPGIPVAAAAFSTPCEGP